MSQPLRVLQVEDSESDAELILRQLVKAGYTVDSLRVEAADEMRAALETREWDIVISDFRMPHFDAKQSLEVLHESGFDYPFIVVSGTIGEDVAVAMMKAGAHDYLMKESLARLVPAVARELRDAEARRARRQAEEARRESEERLKLALQASATGVWEWDLATNAVFWSPECYRVIGIAEFGETFDSFQQLVHPDDWERVLATLKRAIADRVVFSAEFRIIRPDSEISWLSNLAQCRYAADGTPLRMVGTVVNITERKKAEAALLESQIMLESVVASAVDAVVVMDDTGSVVLWNHAAERIFGYSTQEALGRTLHELVAPEPMRAAYAGGFARFLMDGTGPLIGRTVELEASRKGGGSAPIELSIAPMQRPGSLWAVGVVRDITDRKLAEAALRESEQRWQFALEGAGDGVWDWKSETKRTYYSRQWKAMLGYEDHEIGDDPEEFTVRLHPDDRERVQAVMDRHARGEAPNYRSEFRLRCKDGSYKWVLGRGKVVARDGSGQPLRIIGTQTDITARKVAEEERDRLQAQFLQAQKMESIGRLAGGIAHDFNNLLTVINGWASVLLRSLAPEDSSREAVEEIFRSGERAAALVKQLLAFSRKDVAKREVVNVNDVISNLEKTVLGLVGTDVEIQTHFEPALAGVLSDRSQLEQVLINLVVNARDAMPSGGTLSIRTSSTELGASCPHCRSEITPGEYICITLRDTGIGMSEQTQAHLFEPFFTTKEVGKGTGLGLAVVHGIVVSSGGHIDFSSSPGHGTEFRIFLPPSEEFTEKKPRAATGKVEGTESILLVEDDPDVRKFIAQALTGYGYRVSEAPSAEEATRILSKMAVDLLVTDITMPKTNGLDLASRARAAWPGLKVLFVSGHSAGILEQRHIQGNFLSKPFSPATLAAKVREILDTAAHVPVSRILVVDDEPAIRRYIRTVLEGSGYIIIEAGNGKEALAKIRSEAPDLVITDLVMPDQEGLETIQKLHTEYPELKIIAMSGAAGGRYLSMAEPLGASLTLQKPIAPGTLVEQVKKVLKRSTTAAAIPG